MEGLFGTEIAGSGNGFNCSTTEGAPVQGVTSLASNVAVTVVIAVFLVVGAAGNVLTIVVILINRPLQNVSNSFILSLCVSDLISAVVCSPLWLYRRTWGYASWDIGPFLCKFYWASDFATSYVTSLHIFSFAGLRFIAIKRPFVVGKIRKRVVSMYICCLWLLAAVAAIPIAIFVGVRESRDGPYGESWPSCSILEKTDESCCVDQYMTYMASVSCVFFYLPEMLVIFFSVWIAYSLVQRRKWRQKSSCPVATTPCSSPYPPRPKSTPFSPAAVRLPDVIIEAASSQAARQEVAPRDAVTEGKTSVAQHTNESAGRAHAGSSEASYVNMRNAFIQLTLIVVAFVLGYVPMTVYLLWTTLTEKRTFESVMTDYWFGVASYFCLRLSECMNPLLYNLGSSNLRRASKRLLRRLMCRGRPRPHLTVH